MPRLSDQELKALLAGASKGPWEADEFFLDDADNADLISSEGKFYRLFDARLAAQAPALAQEVLDLGEAGGALREALERIQITTQDESLEALCAIALARWAELHEAEEERDGLL